MKLSTRGLETDGDAPAHRWLAFVDSVLRGVGQVMFQDNSYAGLLFLVGIACNSALYASAALLGTAVSTGTAMLLRCERTQVRSGLFGFNGGLVAIALLYFLQPDALTWGCVVFAAACSTIVMAALRSGLQVIGLPALTAPFVFTSLCFFLATARFGRLQSTELLPTAGLPQSVSIEGVVSAATIGAGLLNGLGQVFFQGNIVTGALFAAGLLVASRLACVAALAGSLAGLLVAWGMGAAEPAIRSGAFGFNSVLAAIALGAVFFVPGRASAVYALLASIVTPFVFAAVAATLQPLGMPPLTLPFVLVTWLFLLAAGDFPAMRMRRIDSDGPQSPDCRRERP